MRAALAFAFAFALASVAVPVAVSAPAHAAPHGDPVARWRAHIDEASARFGVPAAWIERVMRAESGGRDRLRGRPIRSPKGAIGLMQLMPATWAETRAALGLGDDPDDPRDNILAGTFYLRAMYDRFGYPGCFAAYNAGPGRTRAWLEGRARLPGETLAYLRAVGAGPSARPGPAAAHAPAGPVGSRNQILFAIRRDPRSSGAGGEPGRPGDALFAVGGRGE